MSEPIDRQHDMPASGWEGAEREAATDVERLTAIRERYARGVYDSPAVLEVVARRLIARRAV